MTTAAQRHQLFISYSHTDREWVDRLQTMIRPLVRSHGLDLWDDSPHPARRKMEGGDRERPSPARRWRCCW